MFDSLADRVKQDEGTPTKNEWVIRFAMVVAVAGVLFGGLYLVVQHGM